MFPHRFSLPQKLSDAITESCPKGSVYVSCNPRPLSRDLKGVVATGLQVTEVQLGVMLPRLPHVEYVALMSRGDK